MDYEIMVYSEGSVGQPAMKIDAKWKKIAKIQSKPSVKTTNQT